MSVRNSLSFYMGNSLPWARCVELHNRVGLRALNSFCFLETAQEEPVPVGNKEFCYLNECFLLKKNVLKGNALSQKKQ